jgi:hypothetical protein
MFDFIFKVWYMIAILPLYMLLEASERFSTLLKKKKIYMYWDVWHSLIVVLVFLLIFLFLKRAAS